MNVINCRSKLIASAVIALLGCVFAVSVSAVTLKEIKKRGYIRVAIANEIPYGFMNGKGEAEGAGPVVARAVLKEMGIDNVQWVVTQFGSLIPGLKANRFDMVAAEMAIRPARCKQVIYSEPNTSYGEGLLVPEGNPGNVHSYSDFKTGDKKVAIMAGADQLDMLQKLGVPSSNMVTINSNADAISTVSTGRAAAYAATGLTASNLASKSDKVQVAEPFTDPVIDGKEVRSWGGFTFNKSSTAFRNAFDKKLVAFKKTAAWKKILSEYGFPQADIEGSFKKTTKQLCSGK
ncbi:ectoine/hydroxyectoine ABC transporter substrate-binding protein EhuB [Mangrovitalea sediminis]|uniref:ectoine/hydroxyectoine ABC transporter substrate-binding protein EhuB n=1 Tax=Mangrovitalea sediminis TaxID=1982043 RepID=UPI000BE60305|nr:ectoine/hydroxyectoine ABC transporter substrate-binding protein EhuB [Mangrovitalea sediminis]